MKPSSDSKMAVSRRDVLKTFGAGAALVGLGLVGSRGFAQPSEKAGAPNPNAAQGPFVLPPLPFAYDALEPHIDRQTMEIHHTKHHQAYITAANKAVADNADLRALEPAKLLGQLDGIAEPLKTTLRNQVGGHANHTFFWTILSPKGGGEPTGALESGIKKTFGSVESFRKEFATAAGKRFGSGWAWLLVKDGKLVVESTANQDSPLMSGALPVLGLDVWEHAYYLKYQNKRAEYVAAFWNVVNWEKADSYYRSST